jgi:hypothetical protein
MEKMKMISKPELIEKLAKEEYLSNTGDSDDDGNGWEDQEDETKQAYRSSAEDLFERLIVVGLCVPGEIVEPENPYDVDPAPWVINPPVQKMHNVILFHRRIAPPFWTGKNFKKVFSS